MNIQEAAKEYADSLYEPSDRGVLYRETQKDFIAGAEWKEKQSPWISVEDRLPEPEQEVFLYDSDSIKHYVVGWLRKRKAYSKSKWFVTNGYVTDDSITYWMPIPKINE